MWGPLGAVFIEERFVYISSFIFRAIFYISIFFKFYFQILECEAFQIFCPLLNFQILEVFPVFRAFPVFLGKKRGKIGKSCSIRTALNSNTLEP